MAQALDVFDSRDISAARARRDRRKWPRVSISPCYGGRTYDYQLRHVLAVWLHTCEQ